MLILDKRHVIAKRIAEELEEGQIVNLGIGIPTLITQYLNNREITCRRRTDCSAWVASN